MTIEIGTSDFRTQAGQVPGIFIEPVKYYFDRLPDCNKINCAISNYEGEIYIYYLTDDEITKYNLPQWVRGCNSVNTIHPSVEKLIRDKGISLDIICSHSVPVRRIKSIIDKHNVTSIDILKIDTEGHDCIILNDFLDTVDILPNKIQFEANVLSDSSEVDALIERLESFGYKTDRTETDVMASRKFENDFFIVDVEEINYSPRGFSKEINIGSIGDPNEAMDLGVRIIHDLGNGSVVEIPIEQYRFNK